MLDSWIDGQFWGQSQGAIHQIHSVHDRTALASYREADVRTVDAAIQSASHAFEHSGWAQRKGTERARVLQRLAKLIQRHHEDLCRHEVQEAGITWRKYQAMDARLVVEAFQTFALMAAEDQAVQPLKPAFIGVSASPNYLRRKAIGVCGLITPWNMPLVLAAWKLAPALAAGNTVVMKPSEYTISSTLRLAQLALEAGVPAGVVNAVLGPGRTTGEYLIQHPGVKKISFTGSTQVGRHIQSRVSSRFLPANFELGGRNTCFVHDVRDSAHLARGLIWASMLHSGQICVAGSWAFIPDHCFAELRNQVCAAASDLKLGNPADPSTELGPLIHWEHRELVLKRIHALECLGLKRLIGGDIPSDLELQKGAFLKPCVLQGNLQHFAQANAELFGPILVLVPYKNQEDVIRSLNQAGQALAVSIWGTDRESLELLASDLNVPTIWINQHHILSAEYPFAGQGETGFGSDLGMTGYRSYQKESRIHINDASEAEERTYVRAALFGEDSLASSNSISRSNSDPGPGKL